MAYKITLTPLNGNEEIVIKISKRRTSGSNYLNLKNYQFKYDRPDNEIHDYMEKYVKGIYNR